MCWWLWFSQDKQEGQTAACVKMGDPCACMSVCRKESLQIDWYPVVGHRKYWCVGRERAKLSGLCRGGKACRVVEESVCILILNDGRTPPCVQAVNNKEKRSNVNVHKETGCALALLCFPSPELIDAPPRRAHAVTLMSAVTQLTSTPRGSRIVTVAVATPGLAKRLISCLMVAA